MARDRHPLANDALTVDDVVRATASCVEAGAIAQYEDNRYPKVSFEASSLCSWTLTSSIERSGSIAQTTP